MREYLNGGGDGVADNVEGSLRSANGDGRDSSSGVQFEESNLSRHFLKILIRAETKELRINDA